MNKHTLYYFDLNQPEPPNLYWLWPIGTLALYAAIGVMLALRG